MIHETPGRPQGGHTQGGATLGAPERRLPYAGTHALLCLVVQPLSAWVARRHANGKSVGELGWIAALLSLLAEELERLAAEEEEGKGDRAA